MHHKRGRPKNRRAGCLMCKPHKQNGWGHKRKVGQQSKRGGSNLKKERHAREDLRIET